MSDKSTEHQQRNKSQHDKMQKASQKLQRDARKHTHKHSIQTQKIANNVPNEIKQKRVVTSENNGEMPMDNKNDCGAQQG